MKISSGMLLHVCFHFFLTSHFFAKYIEVSCFWRFCLLKCFSVFFGPYIRTHRSIKVILATHKHVRMMMEFIVWDFAQNPWNWCTFIVRCTEYSCSCRCYEMVNVNDFESSSSLSLIQVHVLQFIRIGPFNFSRLSLAFELHCAIGGYQVFCL